MKYKIVVIAVVLLASHFNFCFGSWAYVPQEVRMLQADLVVVGKIEKTVKQVEKNGTIYDVGVIKPTAILKGKPAMMGDIRVAWPAPRPGGLVVSTTIQYRVGQEGIWVLQADEKLPVHWATYPTDYQRMENLDTVKKKVAGLKKIQWSKPVAGLQIGMLVEQRDLRKAKVKVNGKSVKAVAQLSVYPLMKNSSENTLHIVNNQLDRPVEISLQDPTGKPVELNLHGNRPKREVPLKAHHFVALQPAAVTTIGYGYGLPILTKAGVYTLELSYNNKRGSGVLKIEPVWKGTASSQLLKVKVPAE